MRLMGLLVEASLRTRQEILPLIVLRLMKLNMKHGMSPQMPCGLAYYGGMFSRIFGSVKEAYRYGEAALTLQQTNSYPCAANVQRVNHVTSFLFVNQLAACRTPLKLAWKSGLIEGKLLETCFSLTRCSSPSHWSLPFNRGFCRCNDLRCNSRWGEPFFWASASRSVGVNSWIFHLRQGAQYPTEF